MNDPVPRSLWIASILLAAFMALMAIESATKHNVEKATHALLEDSPDPGCLQPLPPAAAPLHIDLSGDFFAHDSGKCACPACVVKLSENGHVILVAAERLEYLADDANPYNRSAIVPTHVAVPAYSRGKTARIRDWVISAPSGRYKLITYLAMNTKRASAAYDF